MLVSADKKWDYALGMIKATSARQSHLVVNSLFSDLGDKRKPEYLEAIVKDALERGNKMKRRVINVIQEAGYQATEKIVRAIIYWNRSAQREHDANEVQTYLGIEKRNKTAKMFTPNAVQVLKAALDSENLTELFMEQQ